MISIVSSNGENGRGFERSHRRFLVGWQISVELEQETPRETEISGYVN